LNTQTVWGTVALVAIIGLFILIWKNKISRFKIKAGPVTADLGLLRQDLDVIKESVAQVNKAVNHQRTGEPTLVERVKNIEARLEEGSKNFSFQTDCLRAIANHVGLNLPEE
jgi:hypothetical protein